ncbi:unnamed protein product [Arctogadus glacialis]
MDEDPLERASPPTGPSSTGGHGLIGGLEPQHRWTCCSSREEPGPAYRADASPPDLGEESQLLASLEETTGGGGRDPGGEQMPTEASTTSFCCFLLGVGGPVRGAPAGRVNGRRKRRRRTVMMMTCVVMRRDVPKTAQRHQVQAAVPTTWGTLEYTTPCPAFFLEYKCRFEDQRRFLPLGGGVRVGASGPSCSWDLFATCWRASACRSRHEDGIWYRRCAASWVSKGYLRCGRRGRRVIPPMREDDLPRPTRRTKTMTKTASSPKWVQAHAGDRPSPASADFGGWEAHTRGIGSRSC